MTTAEQQKAQQMASHWWLLLINGVSLVIVGALLLANPARSTVWLVQVLGIYWVIAGIFNLIGALMGSFEGSRAWAIILAIIYIIAGIVILGSPISAALFTTAFLLYLLAFSAIINGILMIFMGRQQASGGRERSFGSFLLGGFNFVIGVLILMGIGDNPILTASSFIWAAAICCIFFGIMVSVMSFRVRGMKAA
jgi:uncharacterized membrane protein HdeD (DUF308 family)